MEKNRARAAAVLEAAEAETALRKQQERQYQRDYSRLQWQQLDLFDVLPRRTSCGMPKPS